MHKEKKHGRFHAQISYQQQCHWTQACSIRLQYSFPRTKGKADKADSIRLQYNFPRTKGKTDKADSIRLKYNLPRTKDKADKADSIRLQINLPRTKPTALDYSITFFRRRARRIKPQFVDLRQMSTRSARCSHMGLISGSLVCMYPKVIKVVKMI